MGVAERSMTLGDAQAMRFTASRPEIHSRAALLFFSASFFSSPLRFPPRLRRSVSPAVTQVVGLVVERTRMFFRLHGGRAYHPLDHLALGFEGIQLLTRPCQARRCPTGAELDPLAEFESVVIGDHDFRAEFTSSSISLGTSSRLT